jgi:hypothetical protein
MEFDTLTLSRVQFAMTIMFHYLFPPLSIGLGVMLVAFGWPHRRTGDPDYRALGWRLVAPDPTVRRGRAAGEARSSHRQATTSLADPEGMGLVFRCPVRRQ